MGADIAVFPEMWQIGYELCPRDDPGRASWQARAIATDDFFVTQFRDLAAELNMAILITYLQKWENAPRNTATLFDRKGEHVLTYAKVHTCDFEGEAALSPGTAFVAEDLDFGSAQLRVGVMICFDREFPESARALMLEGAEIILVPNACYLEPERLSQVRVRAFENMVGIAMANYAESGVSGGAEADFNGHGFNGHSAAYSGIVCDEDGRALNQELVEADTTETIALASFDLDKLRAYRSREIWGDAYRKPKSYQPLLATSIHPTFARRDSRRHASPTAANGST